MSLHTANQPLGYSNDAPGNEFRFILASGSKRRHDIMTLAGLIFVVQDGIGSASEKVADSASDPRELTSVNAELKLDAALDACQNHLPWNIAIIAADTLVSLDSKPLGKPANADAAVTMLRDLRGRQHEVLTSVAMTYPPYRQRGERMIRTVTSGVVTRSYDEGEIERYVSSGIPYDRAGAYGIQDSAFHPVDSVIGCYLNIVGLPLCAVRSMLPPGMCTFTNAHIYATCAAHEQRTDQ